MYARAGCRKWRTSTVVGAGCSFEEAIVVFFEIWMRSARIGLLSAIEAL